MPGEVVLVEELAEISYLRRRIQELEEKVEQLRLSRRVLMNLIEKIEREKNGFLSRLERENRKLHQDNYRYARRLLRKNRQIVELESKLEAVLPVNKGN
ncbi:MAG: translation initiation factor 2 [Pelotomaculum sp.]|nr:translation initiation factor 2 [Pelotomaculum sp.]